MDSAHIKRIHANSCKHCGRSNHLASDCRFKSAKCHNCGNTGHIAPVCRQPRKPRKFEVGGEDSSKRFSRPHKKSAKSTKYVSSADPAMNTETSDEGDQDELSVFTVRNPESIQPIMTEVIINGKNVSIEVDTGAAITLISQATWKNLFPKLTLQKSRVTLKTYTAEKLRVLGQREVSVEHNGQKKLLIVTVVDGDGPPLMGRDWLKHLRLDWHRIANINAAQNQLEELLSECDEILQDELGTVKDYQANLLLKKESFSGPEVFHS